MIFLTILLLTFGTFFAKPVSANQVYHTQNLDLTLTAAGMLAGHPVLRAGHVINIHANGPVIGALERYLIEGAKSDTAYQVKAHVFTSCGGSLVLTLDDTTLMTDTNGNAHGGIVISDSTIDGLLGSASTLTFGVQWVLISEGTTAYQTVCTTVTLI